MKFYQWYSQALGGIIGIVSCIYCYLKGDLLIYSSLDGNFDMIGFNSILASYILYPLCFLTFIMAIVLAMPNINQKKVINIEVTKINSVLLYITLIVGILGCSIYFIIPALLLLLKDIVFVFKYIKLKYKNKHTTKNTKHNVNEENDELNNTSTQLLSTKTEMAVNLLNNSASINFITEVTGLSEDYVTKLNETKLKREETTKK